MLCLVRTDPNSPNFQLLVASLDHYLVEIDGDERAPYAQFDGGDTRSIFRPYLSCMFGGE
ncbi:MAG: hypothetical protein ACRYFR_13060 [Janthinobacterium lividum]